MRTLINTGQIHAERLKSEQLDKIRVLVQDTNTESNLMRNSHRMFVDGFRLKRKPLYQYTCTSFPYLFH
jgi:hypothetical protein